MMGCYYKQTYYIDLKCFHWADWYLACNLCSRVNFWVISTRICNLSIWDDVRRLNQPRISSSHLSFVWLPLFSCYCYLQTPPYTVCPKRITTLVLSKWFYKPSKFMPGHTSEHPNGSGSIFKHHGNDSILNRETPNGLRVDGSKCTQLCRTEKEILYYFNNGRPVKWVPMV